MPKPSITGYPQALKVLILGALSMFLTILPPVGLVLGIYACKLGLRERERAQSSEYSAWRALYGGFILGAVGTIVNALSLVCLTILLMMKLLLKLLPG